MVYEDNPFAENSLHENVTIVISAAFSKLLEKAVKGYRPEAKVDTIFISEKEAQHYSWQNGWEVGSSRLDLSGRNKDFIAKDNGDLQPIGALSVENVLVLLNGIVRKWEKYECEETPAGVICDVQFAGELTEYNVYIVPIGFKAQWDNTRMINVLFSSFARSLETLMPTIEKRIKRFKTIKDAELLLNNDEVTERACIKKLNEIVGEAEESRTIYDVLARLAIQPYESQSNHGSIAFVEEIELEKSSIVNRGVAKF